MKIFFNFKTIITQIQSVLFFFFLVIEFLKTIELNQMSLSTNSFIESNMSLVEEFYSDERARQLTRDRYTVGSVAVKHYLP